MSSQTSIDNRTADVIRSALALAQAGRIKEAREIAERGLGECADAGPLHALIGALLCASSDFEPAIPHLKVAHTARAKDPVVLRNLATALAKCERYDELSAVLTDDVTVSDRSGALRRLRGFARQMTADFAGAIEDFQPIVEQHPEDWETWNNLGNARIDAGDATGGIAALRRAAELNPLSAPGRLNLARSLRDSGDLDAAEAELRSMAADFPSDAVPLADLFQILRDQGREEAEDVLTAALGRDPRNLELHLALGSYRVQAQKFPAAEKSYRTALGLDPASGEAYFGLATVLEHDRPDDLAQLARDAATAGIDDDRLSLVRAFAARRAKEFQAGLAALARVPEDFEPAIRWHLAGQMLDSLGRYDEAFAAFTRMNEAHAADPTEPLRRAAEVRENLGEQLRQTSKEWKDAWASPPVASERPAPVFLAGFPRSGTTLLDTMLLGHPAVEVMEEPPIFRQLDAEFGGFDTLADMSEDSIRQAQRRYFELAANHTELRDGSLLIDKSPLYLQRVPQIRRLFPDARFILALRHPADVLLSCFISNFRLNSSMSNFLLLDTAAAFYDLSFNMWERALSLFDVDVHAVVYERMIEDPETALRPVVEGLGLEWKPEILDHQKTAETRGVITTASYAQVTEPLYRGSAGRWQHYRKHLEPVLPILRPWAEKFGYEI